MKVNVESRTSYQRWYKDFDVTGPSDLWRILYIVVERCNEGTPGEKV